MITMSAMLSDVKDLESRGVANKVEVEVGVGELLNRRVSELFLRHVRRTWHLLKNLRLH